jgi:hypothetical protein
VRAYNDDPDNAPAPTIDSPLDWEKNLRQLSPYNDEIVGLLTERIISKLENHPQCEGGPYPTNIVRNRVANVLGTIKRKEAFLVKKEAAAASGNAARSAQLKKDARWSKVLNRRYSRRHTVRNCYV